MGLNLRIADFGGGKSYAVDGKYTQRDLDTVREMMVDSFRQMNPELVRLNKLAGVDISIDIDEFIDFNLKALDELLPKYLNLEKPDIWHRIGPTLPQIFLERDELRKIHNFSVDHAKEAIRLSEYFYEWSYATLGTIYKAEEAIVYMMKGDYKSAADAFEFPLSNWPVKDIILRKCLKINQAFALRMAKDYEGAAKIFEKLIPSLVPGTQHPDENISIPYISLLDDVIKHNFKLLAEPKDESNVSFELHNIKTFLPLLYFEEPVHSAYDLGGSDTFNGTVKTTFSLKPQDGLFQRISDSASESVIESRDFGPDFPTKTIH